MQLSFAILDDESDDGPLYLRLQAQIRKAILDGALQPLEALPPERELAVNAGVSRVTVRKALEGLVAEGLIQQRHGSGTFVAPQQRRFQQGLSHLTSFTEDMRARGHETASHWLERSTGIVTPEEAMRLALSPGARVARLSRMRRAGQMPIVVEHACVPSFVLPDLDLVDGSLYDAMDRAGRRPVRALQRISAANLDHRDAALLEAAAGSAALSMTRVSFDADGRPVEFTRSLFRGDVYDFVVELTV